MLGTIRLESPKGSRRTHHGAWIFLGGRRDLILSVRSTCFEVGGMAPNLARLSDLRHRSLGYFGHKEDDGASLVSAPFRGLYGAKSGIIHGLIIIIRISSQRRRSQASLLSAVPAQQTMVLGRQRVVSLRCDWPQIFATTSIFPSRILGRRNVDSQCPMESESIVPDPYPLHAGLCRQ